MPRPRSAAKPYVILVAEHNPWGTKIVRVTLEKAGYTVQEARDGRSTLEMMSQHPDLIIQDLLLPDIDGFELVRKVRGLPGGGDIPIIAYSGLMTDVEQARSIEAGFTDYLFKPIAPERLLEVVETYLPSRENGKDAGARRRLLVVDDDPTHRTLAKVRLEHAGFTVATAGGAMEALTLARGTPPELIVSDILMPEIDGFRLCLAIRGDAQLSQIPVLLYSAAFNEDADRKLAHEAGANGLVLKTPDFQPIVEAVISTLAAPHPQAVVPVPALGEDYSRRIAQQLDRYMLLTTTIRRRLMRREAELAILSSLFDALKHGSADALLEETLHRVMQFAGASRGVIYFAGLIGSLVPRAKFGYPNSVDRQLGNFFGHARLLHLAMEEKAPRVAALRMPGEILSRGEAPEQSALIAPLLQGDECMGVLVMTSGQRALTEELLPFAGVVGRQIGHAVGLARTLAEAKAGLQRSQDSLDRSADSDRSRPLRTIIIDDDAARVDPVIHNLNQRRSAPEWRRAETESEYLGQLSPATDLIVSRLTLSNFDARRALELLQAKKFDIPFIIISSAADEEAAAALVMLGAADYIPEDRLDRLGKAVQQALDQRSLRRRMESGDVRLLASEERYRALFNSVPVGLYRAALDGQILDVNPALVQMLRYPDRETLLTKKAAELYIDPEARAQWTALLERSGTVAGFESQQRRFDGSTMWVRAQARAVRDRSGWTDYVEGTVVDITDQKHAEAATLRRTAYLDAFYNLSRRLRATRRVEEMYPIIVEHGLDMLRGDHGALELLTPDRGALTRAYAAGVLTEQSGSTSPVAGTRPGQVVRAGATFVTADFSRELHPVEGASQHRNFGPLAIVPLRSEQEIIGTLMLARVKAGDRRPFLDAEVRLLEAIAEIAGTAIRRAGLYQDRNEAYVQMILTLAEVIESRDAYRAGHGERMVRLAEQIARGLGCGEGDVQNIRWGARLHDVGKIGVPESILAKPGGLTEGEWKMIRQHPLWGEDILESVERMRGVAKLVRHHKERWDGTGYPDQLPGERIPLGARILAVVDAYGAITEARPYQPARTHAEAVAEIRRCAETQFDPKVVAVFAQVADRIEPTP